MEDHNKKLIKQIFGLTVVFSISMQQIWAISLHEKTPTTKTNDGITYNMDTIHTVSFSDGATVYAADFRNKQVIAGQVEGKRFGGGGYGSLKTFEEFNKKAIDEARDAGCFIAKQVIETPENPWYTYSIGGLLGDFYERRIKKAEAFKNAYCVPKNG